MSMFNIRKQAKKKTLPQTQQRWSTRRDLTVCFTVWLNSTEVHITHTHTLCISGRNNPHVRNPVIRYSATKTSCLGSATVNVPEYSYLNDQEETMQKTSRGTPMRLRLQWNKVVCVCVCVCVSMKASAMDFLSGDTEPHAHLIQDACIWLHETVNIQILPLYSWFPRWHLGSTGICRWQNDF